MAKKLFNWTATVLKIVDGDTAYLDIDLGCKVHLKTNCRFDGINAPETGTPGAAEAKAFVAEWMPVGSVVFVDSKMLDKYDRPVVVIRKTETSKESLNQIMLDKGLAKVYQ